MTGKARKIAIVGGTGKMGSLAAKLLKKDGFEITICSRKPALAKKVAERLGVAYNTLEGGVKEADIVLVSVPIETTYKVCKQAAKQMRNGALLIDIASVKTGIADKLTKELPNHVKYLSLHPLFGPQAPSLNKQNVVVIKSRMDSCSRKVVAYLKSKGAQVSFLSVDQHDRAMAIVQAMHHFAMLSFLHTLSTQLSKFKEPEKLTTRSLRLTLKSIDNILKNLDSAASIQKNNPYAKEIRKTYLNLMTKLAKMDLKEISSKIKEKLDILSP